MVVIVPCCEDVWCSTDERHRVAQPLTPSKQDISALMRISKPGHRYVYEDFGANKESGNKEWPANIERCSTIMDGQLLAVYPVEVYNRLRYRNSQADRNYQLALDIIPSLAMSSALRLILACMFGLTLFATTTNAVAIPEGTDRVHSPTAPRSLNHE